MSAGRFAFVMPIVHPASDSVSDYSVVERLLRATITSVLSQTHPDVTAIVVCERAPAWAGEYSGRAVFLEIFGHPAFVANPANRTLDKSKKYCLGALYALVVHDASWVMLMDGDDFVNTGLASRIAELGVPAGMDGYFIRRGLHALLEPAPDAIRMRAAFVIDDFNKTCGTCRIMTADALSALLARIDRDILDLGRSLSGKGSNVIRIDHGFIDTVMKLLEPYCDDPRGPVFLLGKHMNLEPEIRLAPIDDVLSCKGCNHGNNVGRRGGDVHWHRVKGAQSPTEVIRTFGVANAGMEAAQPGLALAVRGAWTVAIARAKAAWKAATGRGKRP
jgi:hypothetical protein